MVKVNDIVKYRVGLKLSLNWGIVKEILEVKESYKQERIGSIRYKVVPLESNGEIGHYYAVEEEILEGYSKYECKEE